MTTLLASPPTDPLLQSLNPEQIQAVEHHTGPLLVAAGAGAGKTGVLTRRIARLLLTHLVEPTEILTSTFTVKAAGEMKERLSHLLADHLAMQRQGTVFDALSLEDQTGINREVHDLYISKMMIGTLHRCFGQILRAHIENYRDPDGYQWTSKYSIVDPNDQQKLLREIIAKRMNLDTKQFNPRNIGANISRLKNANVLPSDMRPPEGREGYIKRVVQKVYSQYRAELASENALDFDDMLMLTARLLKQNIDTRLYWHHRFRHILVDEYQDTNQCQFDVLRLIVAGQALVKEHIDWSNRSFFVVGDIDQAIYSFRGADYQIMLNFQADFGDGKMDKTSNTMILLEKNYRSTSTIIQAANHVIQVNQQRVDKTLESTRGKGHPIVFKHFVSENSEAHAIAKKVKELTESNQIKYSDIAVLFRNNSISRALESVFVSSNIPHILLKGVRFFERKEIKDLLSYLQFIDNQTNDAALMRIVNIPKRGVGATTIEKIKLYAYERDLTMWDVLLAEDKLKEAIGRSNKGLTAFIALVNDLIEQAANSDLFDLMHYIVDKIEYFQYLEATAQHSDEATERKSNVFELYSAIRDYLQETKDPSIHGFLEAAALQLEASRQSADANAVTLMTIHASKGLEYNVVFIAGVEDDIIPSYRALQFDDAELLEEERRLFYVAMTRAKDQLFLSAVNTRSNQNGESYPKNPSMFLAEIPMDYMTGDLDVIFD